jgi:Transposase IS66 family
MSLQSISQGLESLFGMFLSCDQIAKLKSKSAAEFRELYERILRDIVAGSVVHADETKITVDKKLGYVWVFANLESVAYVFSDTRDARTLKNVLGSFAGVLVSDFYAAYDSIDSAQQKCLIHLLRDINEDVLRNPFNGEMDEVARSFAGLVKPMVDTLDRFGLKAWHLRKHKKAVESFFRRFQRRTYQTEVAIGYKKRFEKNRDKLFTFLDYDGVPWNNNNAEHAIKSVAQMRRAVGSKGTARSIKDALVLLSIKDTCKYKGVNFLDFLRSGDMNIDVFAARSSARARH